MDVIAFFRLLKLVREGIVFPEATALRAAALSLACSAKVSLTLLELSCLKALSTAGEETIAAAVVATLLKLTGLFRSFAVIEAGLRAGDEPSTAVVGPIVEAAVFASAEFGRMVDSAEGFFGALDFFKEAKVSRWFKSLVFDDCCAVGAAELFKEEGVAETGANAG